MEGLMQNWPLLVGKILDHARDYHGKREVVTRSIEGPVERTTYAQIHSRARKMAKALEKWGVREGDRVATLAWNTSRHLESWYGIAGIGAVYHTINPRLFPEQIGYIANHAGDRVLFTDLTFLPLLDKLAPMLQSVEAYVVMTDAAHMPSTGLKGAVSYEEFISGVDDDFTWKTLDENAACGLCYTSGTTGNPKGVLYSHRSNVLHALACNAAGGMSIKSTDTMMPVVPMFHANAWAIAFYAPMAGAKLVMPGARLDAESLYELLETEQVTMTAAVPTLWMMLAQYLEKTGKKLTTLKRVGIGGAACPPALMQLFEKKYGIEVIHAWGMTEMSPVGTISKLKPDMETLPPEQKMKEKLKQGFPPFTVEMAIADDEGRELPWDGKTFGHLKVRGPAVSRAYFRGDGGGILDKDGFFDTGDIATIDEYGFMQITDRAKDVIKSGGEWISSIEIENLAAGHPAVAEAAVIGVPHPKWDERPLLVVVKKPGVNVTRDELLDFLKGRIAKWWMPDDVVFLDQLPHTATGKVQKIELRQRLKDYKLPETAAPSR